MVGMAMAHLCFMLFVDRCGRAVVLVLVVYPFLGGMSADALRPGIRNASKLEMGGWVAAIKLVCRIKELANYSNTKTL